jgi:UDP-N-acetylglucosamine 4-epimerase
MARTLEKVGGPLTTFVEMVEQVAFEENAAHSVMTNYQRIHNHLCAHPQKWLVTGAAGFIGSNLVEALLRMDQQVIGLDNFSTGHRRNLEEVQSAVPNSQWARFTMLDGDIRDLDQCRTACRAVDYVLHQAALGSVPRSLERPLDSHAANVTGTLNMLLAARDAGVRRIVYASSSSVYGDEPSLPKVEERIGRCLSPYAATKLADEIYAGVFGRCYGLETIGLRYFNVFGPRQDPDGAYAAVIPKWIAAMMSERDVIIYGDGETSRDFCYVANVVQANILAATSEDTDAVNRVYNVAVRARTSLNELFELIRTRLLPFFPHLGAMRPVYRDFRPGDVRHSEASIDLAQRCLGYAPQYTISDGLDKALDWYRSNLVKG